MSTAPETSRKAAIRRSVDANNTHDHEVISKAFDEIFEPDLAASSKEVFAMLHRAFPDLTITIEELVEEGDKMVSRQTVTGTHRGEYMGLPPTGKTITYSEIFILRFAGDRVADAVGVVDVLAQLKQLGALPA